VEFCVGTIPEIPEAVCPFIDKRLIPAKLRKFIQFEFYSRKKE
jgi:hypothetical protein